MAKENDMANLGGEIPKKLNTRLDEAVVQLGLVKKRAIAAAIAAWLEAGSEAQIESYHSLYERYYAPGPTSQPGEAGAAVRRAGERAHKKRKDTGA